MKKNLILFMVVLFLFSVVVIASDKDILKAEAKTEEVQTELEEPDGVSIKFLPDGGYKIWARGTGVYDFDDHDDRKDALKEAALEAKANLSKFLEEKITTDDSIDRLVKKLKNDLKKDGKRTANVSREQVKATALSIKVSSKNILKGVLTLETLETPNSSGEGGKITVTIGVSPKSMSLANRVKSDMRSNKKYSKTSKNKTKKKDKKERKKSKTEW